MGLEAATFINDFVVANPLGSDPKSQGDDHLRLIKTVLQATFPLAVAARKFRDDTASAADTLDWILFRNRNGVVGDLIAGYQINGKNTAGTEKTALLLQSKWLNVGAGTEQTQALLSLEKAGALTTLLTLDSTAGLTLVDGKIQFPATQLQSSDPNNLDDYEEGTFNPTIAFGGASVGVTYAGRTGVYTKIGRMVFATIFMTLSSKGSSVGSVTIGSLPFAPANVAATTVGRYTSFSGLTGALHAVENGTDINLEQTGATGTSVITDTNITNSSSIYLTCCYQTAT
jgi:hypothetical protein